MRLPNTRPPDTSSSDAAERYARRVGAGEVLAGPLVHLGLRDISTICGMDRRVDCTGIEDAAEWAIGFFRDVLCLNGGEHEGKPFVLHESQAEFIGSLFGWKRRTTRGAFESPSWNWRRAMARRFLAAGIGLYMMLADGDGERRSMRLRSTRIRLRGFGFRDAVAMIDQCPHLAARLVKSGAAGREWTSPIARPDRSFGLSRASIGAAASRAHARIACSWTRCTSISAVPWWNSCAPARRGAARPWCS